MTSLTPSRVFWPKLVGGWICRSLRWLRPVGKEWRSRRREKGEEFSLNKLGLRCLLELAPGLAAPGMRTEVGTGGITLGSSAYAGV